MPSWSAAEVPTRAHAPGRTRSDQGNAPTESSRTPKVKMVVGQGVTPNAGEAGQAWPAAEPSSG